MTDHPPLYEVDLVFPDGLRPPVKTRSTRKFSGGKLFVETPRDKHPAWNLKGAFEANQSNKRVADFQRRFGGQSFLGGAS